MTRSLRLTVAALGAVLLTTATLTAATTQAAPGRAGDPAAAARGRLADDATGAVRTERGGHGDLVFAGVPAGGRVENPEVGRDASVVSAARAHLSRYGAAFGAQRPGTGLTTGRVTHTVSGQDVVHFDQRVGGVPVIGGEIVVNLRPDRTLGSMLATLSRRTAVPAAVVSERAAARVARQVTARSTGRSRGALDVTTAGRWLFDPAVLGAATTLGARTGWRFEVTGGADVRHLVLVDDQSGGVLLDVDDIQGVDRVVCDNANALVADVTPCTSGFARTEGGAASAVTDVNQAYDLSGVVSDYYQQVGGLDLTALLGINVGGAKKLASTVRQCFIGETCPYGNAFWNGRQMYYGEGYAGADDVVGHEMTHGVVDQYSELFYWGQSGAINESVADIMGEIVDHRHPSAGDTPTDWELGEDLPIGAIRDLSSPTSFGQPDRMTSALWDPDTAGYGDNGGVHTNSGVGNKTAYLISQGGSFNGQTVTGIDGSDAGLTKTGRLYLDVIQSLSSGSDYADLARVLDQSCQDLLAAASPGFTAADCTNVAKATSATQLRTTPTNAAQPPDAPSGCPTGTSRVVLLDSEAGTPTTTFTAVGGAWTRNSAAWGPNATSGRDSWFARDLPTVGSSRLVAAAGVALPAGQESYLWFQHWRLLDYDGGGYYDGGTVEVDDLGDGAGPLDVSGLPWVNGPSNTLFAGSGNPAGGRPAFGGDSLGWVASRVDLSSYAGRTIAPQFSLNTDSSVEYIGWWLDDVTVYTCSPAVTNTTSPTISGSPVLGATLTANPGSWTPAGVTFAYQWFRGATPIAGATSATYVVAEADGGQALTVQVTGSKTGLASATATSAAVNVPLAAMSPGTPTITGSAVVGRTLSADPGDWSPAGVTFGYQWLRGGNPIGGATGSTYRLQPADQGSLVTVRVTGTRTGYQSATATSPVTGPVKGVLTAARPTISGQAVVGHQLVARPGTWSPSGVTFHFQWFRGSSPVAGATGRSYTLKGADRGSKMHVRVTGSKPGYVSRSRTSASTRPVV